MLKTKYNLYHKAERFLQDIHVFSYPVIYSAQCVFFSFPIPVSWVLWSNTKQYKAMLTKTKAVKSMETWLFKNVIP